MNKEEVNKQDIEPVTEVIQVSVNQYGLDGKFIKTFDSMSEAAAEVNITTSEITMCLIGVIKTAGGYQWRKTE